MKPPRAPAWWPDIARRVRPLTCWFKGHDWFKWQLRDPHSYHDPGRVIILKDASLDCNRCRRRKWLMPEAEVERLRAEGWQIH